MRWDNGASRYRYVRIDVTTGTVEGNSLLGASTTLAKAFLTVPDLTGDGVGDVVFLTVDEGGGNYEAFVRHGSDGGFYKKLLYGVGDGFTWFDLLAVGGAAGPGTWGIGAQGVNTGDGRTRVQVKNVDTSALISNVDFSKK